MSQRCHLLILTLLALLAAGAYAHTLSYPFQFDDYLYIVENPAISYLNSPEILCASYQTRCVGLLSFALNYQFGGFSPEGYRGVNILLHFLTASTLYFFALALFSQEKISANKNKCLFLAFVTASLFLLHPIQTQAVTYIWQRVTTLATFFYLLTLFCYIKERYFLAFFFAIFAVLSKQIAATLPATIILLEFFFLHLNKENLKERLPRFGLFTVPSLLIPIIMIFGEDRALTDIQELGINQLSIGDYFLTQLSVICTYLSLLSWPVSQNLDHDFRIATSFFELRTLVAFSLLLGLLGLAWHLFQTHRIVSFGILFFFVTLSVESSIIPLGDVIFEHRVYLPSAGIFLAIGGLLASGDPKKALPFALFVVLALSLSTFAYMTYQRNIVWSSHESLWEDVVAQSPNKLRGIRNLGVAKIRIGKIDEGLRLIERAYRKDPQNITSTLSLARAYIDAKKTSQAQTLLKEAIANGLENSKVLWLLSKLYYDEKNFEEAKEVLEKLLQSTPNNVRARFYLGRIYEKTGLFEQASNQYRAVLEIHPSSHQALADLSYVSEQQKDFKSALAYLQKALFYCKQDSCSLKTRAGYHMNLAALETQLGNQESALQHRKKAGELLSGR